MHLEVMTMSVGDPKALLDAMSTMLGEFGDIKSPEEVGIVISLMKDADKLLKRCIFLNIIRATIESAAENSVSLETVHQFVKDGGCAILNTWLSDAKDLENLPLILDVLEILEAMPITIETLKQGNIGKLVKQLTRSEEKGIKELASNLLNKWMILVKGKHKKAKKSDEDPNNSGSPTMKRQRENVSAGKSDQPPEKKAKSLSEAKSNVTSVAKPPPKTKVIAPLPKPVVMESSGFMNALQSASVPKIKKKKKVAPPPSPKDKQSYAGPLEEILQNQTQTHGEEKDKPNKEKEKEKEKVEKEKVEKDEEKEKEHGDEKGDTQMQESQESNPQNKSTVEELTDAEKTSSMTESESSADASPNEVTNTEVQVKPSNEDSVEPMEPEVINLEVKSEVKPDSKKKKKKSIKWADDEKLLVYHYYEPDEEEKAVQHVVNFHDAQHQEAIRERQRVEQAKRLSEDKMMEKQAWYRPKPLEVTELMERGNKSEEKINQKERESKILPDLFFSKSSLPISPGEPDLETGTGPTPQPVVIPHDEKGTIYPPSKGAIISAAPPTEPAQDPGVSLPPALAALLANATKGPGNQISNPAGSGNNTSLSNVDVQTLLKKLMGSAQNQEEQGPMEDTAEHMRNEPRFPSPLMSQQLRIPGRVPGDQGPRPVPQEPPRHGLPEYRPRGGLLRTPGPPDHPRFPGPRGPPRGRFHPPGGPRFRHPMPGQRMPGPGMGRGGMPNRFQIPDGNRDSGEEFYNDQYNFNDGENLEGPGHMMGPRGRGTRGKGRGRPTCRHFMSPRGCLRGNTCTFLHPGVNGPPV